MSVRPYAVAVDAMVINDLHDRISRTRWPDQVGQPWEYGTDLAYLRELLGHWRDRYDWTAQQRRLNEVTHKIVEVDGCGLHVVHEPGDPAGGQPLPVLLLHGWPSSFVQMLPLLPMLTRPTEHGGRPNDAFDVVALSLPGYGFSDRPGEPGMDAARIAQLVVEVMAELGYPRFVGRGSDLGAAVLQQVALSQPDRLIALHLSGTNPYLGPVPVDLTDAEREFVAWAEDWNATEIAYAMQQSTRPQTLAYGLNDSPAGLAGWIVEKFRRWSDCGGDLDSVFSRDDLLTNLTVYWAGQTIASSVRLYYEIMHSAAAGWGRVEVPTGVAMSGADMFPTPREWAERSYNVTHWTELPRGGHFLEWEVPDLIAEDMRLFLRSYRT